MPDGRVQSFIDRVSDGWLSGRDRADVFTEAAGAATDAGIAYWVVLLLAGAIAALGLALNSSAVVIGAMLIAPLLSPVVGLGLSLAIGDGRLAVETAAIVVVSTLAVILTSALLALALPVPFQTITAEIAARTRPTTLDLAIAVCSGLAGAAVTVARRSRLSGAVPGVAVSVALVPPLAVTGYGIGTGWNWPIIRGSLLLYGANLAGIVMSAMFVFLVAGMHRSEVLDVDRRWHRDARPTLLIAWVERVPGVRSLGVMRSIWTRVGLVAVFVGVVAIPLSASLREIARESRVHAAVDAATRLFTAPGKSFVVSRDVELDQRQTRVVLNVATTGWFGDSARHEFERRASAAAGEPVTLVLEQLPASSGDLSQLATLISLPRTSATAAVAPVTATTTARIATLREGVAEAVRRASLPDSGRVLATVLAIGDSGAPPVLHLAYSAPDSVVRQSAQLVERQLAGALNLPDLRLELTRVAVDARPLRALSPSGLDSVARLVGRYPRLAIELRAGSARSQSRVDSAAARLVRAGVPGRSIVVVPGDSGAPTLRITPR